MGNLGRAGYGASVDGLVCFPQPEFMVFFCLLSDLSGRTSTMNVMSVQWRIKLSTVFLKSLSACLILRVRTSAYVMCSFTYASVGQRLSRCTCPGSSHPGPMHSDGTYVGRSAPEIGEWLESMAIQKLILDGCRYSWGASTCVYCIKLLRVLNSTRLLTVWAMCLNLGKSLLSTTNISGTTQLETTSFTTPLSLVSIRIWAGSTSKQRPV